MTAVVHEGPRQARVEHRALEAYEHFDTRDNGWTKVVLQPTTAGS